MNDNSPPKKAKLPITHGMVEAGIATLDRLTQVDTPEEDATDSQVVIQIFTSMWKTYMAEQQADFMIKASRLKLVPKPKLILPGPTGSQ